MKRLLMIALLVPFTAAAANLDCTTKASHSTKKAELTSMAKVSGDEAQKAALGAVKTSGATIAKGGLEVEDGCVVYSYDVKIPGKSGMQEVYVDAGNGKVLKSAHESAMKEGTETVADTTKHTTAKLKDKVTQK